MPFMDVIEMVDSELSYLFGFYYHQLTFSPYPIVAILCMLQQLIFEFIYR